MVGFHRSSISSTEIAAFYDADPQSTMDVPGIDLARMDIYPVAIFGRQVTSTPGATPDQAQHWRRLNWPWKNLPEGDALNVHAFNVDDSALTTGSFVEIELKIIEEFNNE